MSDMGIYVRRDSAVKLIDGLAGESPASAGYPVGTVVISGDGAGDQTVGSPDVNVLDGDSVPKHTGPISLTDTHLEPSVLRTRPTTTRENRRRWKDLIPRDTQAACRFNCLASNSTPFFQIVVDLDAQRREARNVGGDAGDVWIEIVDVCICRPTPSMGMPLFFEISNHRVNCVGLDVDGFPFGIVIEQERLRIGRSCPAEHLFDVGRRVRCQSDSGLVVPNRGAEMPAFVEGLVEDIPRENLSAIVRYDTCDVFLQECGKLLRREMLAGQPWWIRPSPY